MIKGKVFKNYKTKKLINKLQVGDIALIKHSDIDRVAGESLVEKGVRAVINCQQTISGRYPNQGPLVLLEAGILILDVCDENLFDYINDGDIIEIRNDTIYFSGKKLCKGTILTAEIIEEKHRLAKQNIKKELRLFIENTLTYADQEIDLMLNLDVPYLPLLNNQQVLVVVRGADYKNDLKLIKPYFRGCKPYLIAVDGGADACLKYGYLPDVIIGDMDSVSDKALKCGSKLIVHAYPDGKSPGKKRLEDLGLKAKIFPAPGTSEDIALLLAYENGAELITAVGTHSSMIDFLEKGRDGMGSTLLTRLKIGQKLVDARGISKIYQSQVPYKHWLGVLLSLMLPLLVILAISQPLNYYIRLLYLKLCILF